MTTSWNDRGDAYIMLINGMSAKETAKRFHVNTNAIIEWARLAGMSIRIGSKGGLSRATPWTQLPASHPRGPHLHRDGHQQRSLVVDTCDRKPSRRRASQRSLERSPGTRLRQVVGTACLETKYHAGVAHYRTMRFRTRDRAHKLDDPRVIVGSVTRSKLRLFRSIMSSMRVGVK